jgi:hypothetical protein
MKVPDMVEVVSSMPLYDTYVAAAAANTPTEIQFFTEARSATKGLNRTNLLQAQRLEAPKSFLVHAIRVAFSPDMAFADILAFYKNYILRFIVGDDEYAVGGLEFFPAGAGLSGIASDGAGSAIEHYVNGLPDPRAINVFEHPIPIGQGENFRVELNGTSFALAAAPAPGAFIRVYLDGVLQRGV